MKLLEFVRRQIVDRAEALAQVVEVLDVVDHVDGVVDARGPAFAVAFRCGA